MSNSLRIIFTGTPDFAAQHLSALLSIKDKYQIVGVLTQPDKLAGRGLKLASSPVKKLAVASGIPILQPITLHATEIQQWIQKKHADIMIVVAYGKILSEIVLNMLPMGCLNVHGSLLPRWRGAAPIQRSILAGDQETGITIMQMDIGIDTGDILYKVSCPINLRDTSATLYHKLAKFSPFALMHTLDLLISGQAKPEKQNNMFANYAEKLSKDEALIDWTMSAEQIDRCIRAFNPWPISYFIADNQLIKVWDSEVIDYEINSSPGTILNADKMGIKIATAKGILNILKIQLSGKKTMLVSDFLNSHNHWCIPGRIIHK